MTKTGLIKRHFEQEIAKLQSVKIELLKKGVTVEDYLIALNEKHNELNERSLIAISDGSKETQNEIEEEARMFCSQTRKNIESLTLKHLNKGYKQ